MLSKFPSFSQIFRTCSTITVPIAKKGWNANMNETKYLSYQLITDITVCYIFTKWPRFNVAILLWFLCNRHEEGFVIKIKLRKM